MKWYYHFIKLHFCRKVSIFGKDKVSHPFLQNHFGICTTFSSRVTIILFDKESLHFFSLIPYSKLKAVTPSDVWICTPSNFFLLHSSYKKYQQRREVIGLFVVIDLIFVTLLANKGQRIVVTSLWQRKKTYEYFYKTHYIFLVSNHRPVCLAQFSMFRKKGWPTTKIRCLCSRSSGNGSNVSKNNKRQVIGQMDYGMVPKGGKRPEMCFFKNI